MIIIGGDKRFKKWMIDTWNSVIKESNEKFTKIRDVTELTALVESLNKQVSDLTITKSKKEEEFERREREIQHKIGLVKQSQELELEKQKLELREANLTTKETAFTEKMAYMQTRMETENKYVREMLESMMKRLPTAEFMMNVKEKRNG